MHRTTILLPERLRKQAERQANAMGISLSELIRRRLADAIEEPPDWPRFFSRAPWTGAAPKDLAAEHDRYLYDGE